MKHILPFLFLLTCCVLHAQRDSLLSYSPLEKMLMEPSRFVRIDTDTIGRVNGLHVGVLTATDLGSGEVQRSVCLIRPGLLNDIVFSSCNYQVDIKELGNFIGALTTMNNVSSTPNTEGSQTYQFLTSSKHSARMENRIYRKNKWDISFCREYSDIPATVAGSCVNIRINELAELIDILKRYQNSLRGDLYAR